MSTKIVACLGSSSTAAKGSFNWIRALEQRPQNADYRFYNFGVGGNLAFNGLQRLQNVIDCHPDIVIVQLGSNDVLTSASKKLLKFLRLWNHIPRDPSPDWFRESMRAIVRRLKAETHACIALCSLNVIGEDLKSTDLFQAEINRLVIEYNTVIEQIAKEEGITYLPVYERIADLVKASPGKAFTAFKILPFYVDTFEQYVLGMSLDEIGRRNGYKIHVDGIHLNSRGGGVIVDLVQDFLGT